MVSHIAFDSRSIKSLLREENHQYFDSKHPVFFKNEEGTSAIDTALENNQIRSVNLMIEYICKYQNSFVYAHLFSHNLIDLLKKGVKLDTLFHSDVLEYNFDFDHWPGTSYNTETK